MTSKADAMAMAECTRLALDVCSTRKVLASARTKATSKRGYWAVTTVTPGDDFDQSDVYRVLVSSPRIRPADVRGALWGQSVHVWWLNG